VIGIVAVRLRRCPVLSQNTDREPPRRFEDNAPVTCGHNLRHRRARRRVAVKEWLAASVIPHAALKHNLYGTPAEEAARKGPTMIR